MVRDLTVKNHGWVPTPLTDEELAGNEGGFPEAIRIRGFRLEKKAAHVIKVDQGERCVPATWPAREASKGSFGLSGVATYTRLGRVL